MLHLVLLATSLAIPAPTHANLIANGTFSAGNEGFKSDYKYSSDLAPTGNYYVGPNPFEVHRGGASFGDHTTGKGMMLILNGSTDPNVTIWQETVKVSPNHKYAFGLWAASWGQFQQPGTDPSPARLLVSINGTPISQPFTVQAKDGVWTKFSAQWASGQAKSAVIRIVDENLEPVGNDFAIDDIVFHL